MTTVKKLIAIIVASVIALGGWLFLRHRNQIQDVTTSQTALQPGEESAVIVEPSRRRIIIVRPNGATHTITLPDRPSRIALMKNDGIKVTAPQWGTEIRPFLVGAWDLRGGKLGIGIDGFYWKRLDVGGGFLMNPSYVQDTSLFVGVSMFVYSNTSITLGIDNHAQPLIGIKVRI